MCLSRIFGRNRKPGAVLAKKEVLDELEYDIQIHESYAGLVVQNPSRYPPSVYGGYD